MKFRNLTPHVIRIRLDASNDPSPVESDLVLEAEKAPIRILETVVGGEYANGVHIRTTQLGEIEGLPAQENDVMLIVSMPTAERAYALGRRDVVSPDSGKDAIRS